MQRRDLLTFGTLGAMMAAAFALRLVNISAEPLWLDEIMSYDIMTHFSSYTEMLAYLRQVEFHPPLYYIIMKWWIGVFGGSTLSLRIPSVFFSVAAIALVYATALRMFSSRRGALLAAAVFAVLPIQIEYGQEARPYAMITFFTVLAVYALWANIRSGRLRHLWVYAFACTVGVYLHYSFMFVIAGLALWRLIDIAAFEERRSRKLTEWLAAHALVAIAFFWWADAFLYKIALSKFTIFDMPRPQTAFRRTGIFESMFAEIVWMRDGFLASKIELIANMIFKSALLVAMVAVVRSRMQQRPAGGNGASGGRALLGLACLYATILVMFIISPLSEPDARMYYRYVIAASVPLALAFGALASRLAAKQGVALYMVLVATLIPPAATVLGNEALWHTFFRIKDGASYINEHIVDGEMILISRAAWRTDLNYYLREDLEATPFLPLWHYGLVDSWSSRATLGIIENEEQVRSLPISGRDVRQKLDRLLAMRQPTGVWLYWFGANDRDVHDWFKDNRWRHAFSSLGPMFPVDHYVPR